MCNFFRDKMYTASLKTYKIRNISTTKFNKTYFVEINQL